MSLRDAEVARPSGGATRWECWLGGTVRRRAGWWSWAAWRSEAVLDPVEFLRISCRNRGWCHCPGRGGQRPASDSIARAMTAQRVVAEASSGDEADLGVELLDGGVGELVGDGRLDHLALLRRCPLPDPASRGCSSCRRTGCRRRDVASLAQIHGAQRRRRRWGTAPDSPGWERQKTHHPAARCRRGGSGLRRRRRGRSAWSPASGELEEARCRPARCRPARCRPARCQPARCQPARCQPARCQPARCQPARCQPTRCRRGGGGRWGRGRRRCTRGAPSATPGQREEDRDGRRCRRARCRREGGGGAAAGGTHPARRPRRQASGRKTETDAGAGAPDAGEKAAGGAAAGGTRPARRPRRQASGRKTETEAGPGAPDAREGSGLRRRRRGRSASSATPQPSSRKPGTEAGVGSSDAADQAAVASPSRTWPNGSSPARRHIRPPG